MAWHVSDESEALARTILERLVPVDADGWPEWDRLTESLIYDADLAREVAGYMADSEYVLGLVELMYGGEPEHLSESEVQALRALLAKASDEDGHAQAGLAILRAWDLDEKALARELVEIATKTMREDASISGLVVSRTDLRKCRRLLAALLKQGGYSPAIGFAAFIIKVRGHRVPPELHARAAKICDPTFWAWASGTPNPPPCQSSDGM